jgi:hypothetical protein
MIHALQHENKAHEVCYIANSICEKIDHGTKPEDIAVIYRKNSNGAELMNALIKRKIPVVSSQKLNVLDNPYIQKFGVYSVGRMRMAWPTSSPIREPSPPPVGEANGSEDSAEGTPPIAAAPGATGGALCGGAVWTGAWAGGAVWAWGAGAVWTGAAGAALFARNGLVTVISLVT